MNGLRWFRGVVESVKDSATGLRTMSALGRGVREVRDAQLMQHHGLASMPKAGTPVLFLQDGDLVVAVAGESNDRPALADGDTVLYATKDVYIKLSPDGSVLMQSGSSTKVKMTKDGTIQLEGKRIVGKALEVDLGEGPLGPSNGVVTGMCICSVTGLLHPVTSQTVRAAQ